MRIVGILALVGSVLFCNNVFARGLGGILSRDFEMVPFNDCHNAPCDTVQPKTWDPDEIRVIDNAILKFKFGGLNHVINFIKAAGFKQFQRASNWFLPDLSKIGFAVSPTYFQMAVAIEGMYPALVFTDEFFKSELFVVGLENVPIQEITVLHEIMHAFDYKNRFSHSAEFLELTGFKASEFLGLSTFKVTEEELAKAQKKYHELKTTDQRRAQEFEREFSMDYGMPSLYSMKDPQEAFAEIATYIYFDATANQYLELSLIEYIDVHVLKGARAY